MATNDRAYQPTISGSPAVDVEHIGIDEATWARRRYEPKVVD